MKDQEKAIFEVTLEIQEGYKKKKKKSKSDRDLKLAIALSVAALATAIYFMITL